jgi:hypothetical protein
MGATKIKEQNLKPFGESLDDKASFETTKGI